MVVFPNAKINLGLNILSKREDGYHDISSCFLPIGWRDILEAIPSEAFEFASSGLDIPGETDSNLCVKAYELMSQRHDVPPVKMHLHKVIPMGAGLGGGSADGAFALKLLNELFEIGLSEKQLESYAGELGADCPFFIQNQPKLVTGTGDVLVDLDFDLPEFRVLVVFPNLHVNTGEAFKQIVPEEPVKNISTVLTEPIETWKENLLNDFEKPVFEQFPEIEDIKKRLYDMGAVYASMSGSGSAVYGLFSPHFDKTSFQNAFSKYTFFPV